MWIWFLIGLSMMSAGIILMARVIVANNKLKAQFIKVEKYKLPFWNRYQLILWSILLIVGFSFVVGAFWML